MSGTLSREERRKYLNKFWGKSEQFMVQAGATEDITFLTDFDGFVTVLYHRTQRGRVYCPKTEDEFAQCPRCTTEQPRATALASIYNLTHKIRQFATFSGPKKGTLATIFNLFNTMGTYKFVLRVGREGSGTDTTYSFVPVAGDVVIPEGIVPHTREELLERIKTVFVEREGEEW